MHDETLNDAQRGLLPLMAQFRREYYHVGGTAIALHIGHRRLIMEKGVCSCRIEEHF